MISREVWKHRPHIILYPQLGVDRRELCHNEHNLPVQLCYSKLCFILHENSLRYIRYVKEKDVTHQHPVIIVTFVTTTMHRSLPTVLPL